MYNGQETLPLVLASAYGGTSTVQLLLDLGCPVDGYAKVYGPFTTPLAAAVEFGDPDQMRLLLEAGADPDLGWPTPLARAALAEDVVAVGVLLQHGAAVNVSAPEEVDNIPPYRYSPLHWACAGGALSICERLVRQDPEVVGAVGEGVLNELKLSNFRGCHDAAIEWLLAAGVQGNGSVVGDYLMR